MPKMKTHSGAKKRFRKLSSKKFKFASSGKRHILTKKTTKRKRNLRRTKIVNPSDAGRIARLLPNT